MEVDNGVSLDFMTTGPGVGAIGSEHYAFLVSEDEFDQIFGRIQERGLDATSPIRTATSPARSTTTTVAAGVYWHDPDGHVLEIITRPYGWGLTWTRWSVGTRRLGGPDLRRASG